MDESWVEIGLSARINGVAILGSGRITVVDDYDGCGWKKTVGKRSNVAP